MSRGYLVLDIETVPDAALYTPPAVGTGMERPFPPPYAHRPIALGVLWLDDSYAFKRLGVVGEGKDEAATLTDFATFVERERPHLVTWNGRAFDLPVLALRCMRHGVPLRFYYQDRDYRYRYTEEGHLDLADSLTDHGAAKSMGLDAVAHVVGLPGKVGVDGSQVEAQPPYGRRSQPRQFANLFVQLPRIGIVQAVIETVEHKTRRALYRLGQRHRIEVPIFGFQHEIAGVITVPRMHQQR